MASWSIHLVIAKGVNEKLKLNKDIFYYSNLIPDVDRGGLITRYQAHYYGSKKCDGCPNEELPDLDRFLNDYKDKLSNPLIVGYYVHLLIDYFYNDYIYTNFWKLDDNYNIVGIKLKNGKVKKIPIKDEKNEKKKYKHYDLELYGKYLFKNKCVELFNYDNSITEYISDLNILFINKESVVNRVNYINNEFTIFNKIHFFERLNGYKMFSKDILDELLLECEVFILNKLKEIGIYNE